MLLCFDTFKCFSVPCDVEDFEPTEGKISLLARPTIARTKKCGISEIEELYGREGDAYSEVEEYLDHPTTFFKAVEQPKKDPPIPPAGFTYNVNAALAASMQDGPMHEWVRCELRDAFRTYGLFVRGNKANVLARVVSHFASKYVLSTIMRTTRGIG